MTEKEIKDIDSGKRLVFLRNQKKISQKLAAISIGIALSTLQRYEYGILPSRKNIKKIQLFYGCNETWLLTGEGIPFSGARDKYKDVCGPGTELVADQPEGAQTSKFVLISQVNGRISAGTGLLPDDSVDIKIAFRRDWIKKKGKPENMSLIKVSGDSMQPTLLSGDIALVDHGHNYIDPQGGIYAIAVDGEIMIKRVQPIPGGKILVISDNKNYERLEMDSGQIQINGKVIWFCRDIER
ncbi:MAG: helix-turn-helix transcriptional regulator [Smithella sp.]